MLLCAPVSSGVSLAEEKTWTKRIVQEETPKAVVLSQKFLTHQAKKSQNNDMKDVLFQGTVSIKSVCLENCHLEET